MQDQTPETDWDAIARFLAGESSAAERASVERWLASRPADARLVASLDQTLAGLKLSTDAVAGIDVDAAWSKVRARRAMPAPTRLRIPGRTTTQPWVAFAAAAAVVIAVGSVVVARRAPSSTSTIAARDIVTPVGKRDSLVLPDGSSVIVGPGTRLTIGAAYGQSERRVAVLGEAYFNVKHDADHPFVVEANGATIRDIGTAFVVHSDSTGGVRVVVKSGIVAVNQSTTLKAGDVATVASDGTVFAQPGTATDDDLAWTQGRLVFRDATLAEVRDDLRRWYGVELAVRDSSMLKRHFTGTFNGDSVSHVLDVMSQALGATIERRGDTAVVRVLPETARRK